MPSIADIAERAGVAKSTASLALRNDLRVKLETRERIQRLAEQMGYRTNPMVTTLMEQVRSGRIGDVRAELAFIGERPGAHSVADAAFTSGFERAKSLGYHLERMVFRPDDTNEAILRMAHARGIRGAVVRPLIGRAFADRLFALPCALVGVGGFEFHPDMHRASSNLFNLVRIVYRRLKESGFRKVGLVINESIDRSTDGLVVASYLYENRSLSTGKALPVMLHGNAEDGKIARWIDRHRPDAVLHLEGGLEKRIAAASPPTVARTSFIHLDNPPDKLGQSGGTQNWKDAGIAAIDLLASRLQQNEVGPPPNPKLVLVEGSWVGPVKPGKAKARKEKDRLAEGVR